LTLLLVTAPNAPAADTTIGFVYDYIGSPNAYFILRGTRRIAVAPIQPLDIGDRVFVIKRSSIPGDVRMITLSIAGQLSKIDAEHSPFCVGAVGGVCGAASLSVPGPMTATLTVLKNIMAAIAASAMRVAKEDYDSIGSSALVSRGPGPLSMPILKTFPQTRLPAGMTTIVIPISGGTAPLQARLFRGTSQQPMAQQNDVNETEIRFHVLNLYPDTYRVQLEDSNSVAATETFDAVAAANIPRPDPEVLAAMNADQVTLRDLGATAYAAILQGQGAQWYLLAYQQLQVTSRDFQPARELIVRLREGP
jgi:hypothetical protein